MYIIADQLIANLYFCLYNINSLFPGAGPRHLS